MSLDHDREDEIDISGIEFEWYPPKASSNLKKHGVSFEEACTVFGDKRLLDFPDNQHDEDDQQNFLTGHGSFLLRNLFSQRDTDSLLDSTKGDTQGLTVWFHCILNGCLGVRDGFRDGRLGARSQKDLLR